MRSDFSYNTLQNLTLQHVRVGNCAAVMLEFGMQILTLLV